MTSTVKPTATTGSRSSPLLKLWIMVFEEVGGANKLEDMVRLWMDDRHVSKYFISLIEDLFRIRYLPEAQVRFHMGQYPLPSPKLDFVT